MFKVGDKVKTKDQRIPRPDPFTVIQVNELNEIVYLTQGGGGPFSRCWAKIGDLILDKTEEELYEKIRNDFHHFMETGSNRQVIPLIDNLEDHMSDSLRYACPLSIWKDVYAESLDPWMKDKELVGFPDFARMPDIDQDITHNPCLEVEMKFKEGQVVKEVGFSELFIVEATDGGRVNPAEDLIKIKSQSTGESKGWFLAHFFEHAPGYSYGYDHNIPIPARIKDPTPMVEVEDEKTRMAKFFARSAHDK